MRGTIKKLILWLLFAVVLFSSSCAEEEPIRVGFVADLSGPNPAVGVDGRDGVLLAAEKINAEGGINGRPLELLVRDARGSPEGAVEAARQLIDEKVPVIFAHLTSGLMLPVWEATKDSGVLYLSPTASTSALSGLDDNFLRLTPPSSVFAEYLAAYAAQKMGLKTFAVIYDTDNAAFTETYKQAFETKAALYGGETLWEYGFSSSAQPAMESVAKQLSEACPESILIIASAADCAWLAQQIRLNGCAARLLTSNWALTKDLVENGGKAVDDILAVATYNENNRSPEYLDFSSQFLQRFGKEPSFSAGYGYETLLFLAEALKKTGGQKEGLKRALLEIQGFRGVFGELSLDEYGDVNRTLYLVTMRNGRFFTKAIIKPP